MKMAKLLVIIVIVLLVEQFITLVSSSSRTGLSTVHWASLPLAAHMAAA
jgi:hypothetical protein